MENQTEEGNRIEDYRVRECLMCGEIIAGNSKFCSDTCAEAYDYENRTCRECGGEFWDGGTSCTCDKF